MKIKSVFARIKGSIFFHRQFSSKGYWNERYESGRDSGPGSYGRLAEFKASVLNEFVRTNGISSVIEFGSGDGNQLILAQYESYVGYDISPVAVESCRKLFIFDASKQFFLAEEYDGRKADLALSLDVLFHLTEDDVFDAYLHRLFNAALKNVVIYSSNQDELAEAPSIHVRHRTFTRWIERELPSDWTLVRRVSNEYPYDGDYTSTSFSDFFIYEKCDSRESEDINVR